ncbi:hypothetical protein [Microbacterium resistens]|uniref:hypothetical protein n=1 Tax=Microbacterium resistens TaxID=156977 RepID=UPI0036720CA7
MNDAIRWIDQVRGNDSMRGAARKAGITSAKLIRQVNDDMLTFETVRDVARAYGRPVLADLVAMGMLTPGDAGMGSVERALSAASDEQLVLEVARRLEVADIGTIYDKPVSEAVEEAKVHRFPPRDVPSSQQNLPRVAKRRSKDPGGDEGEGA